MRKDSDLLNFYEKINASQEATIIKYQKTISDLQKQLTDLEKKNAELIEIMSSDVYLSKGFGDK